jgi:hypothetical protein
MYAIPLIEDALLQIASVFIWEVQCNLQNAPG